MNKLILGDNLEIMRKMESGTIDLIYLDPPFFSNRNYEVLWGDEGEIRSFQDRWSGGIEHYIGWLKERVQEMHRLLKPTGSIFLHCDWHANSHIRVNILEKLFGENNFRNEIIWQRTNNPKGSQFEKRNLGVATDTIWWYSKSDKYFFDEKVIRENLNIEQIERKYPYKDENGYYYQGPIIRGASMGERPNLVYEYNGFIPEKWGWRMTKEKLTELDKNGDLGWSSKNKPFRKLRPINDNGNPIYNFWNDIPRMYSGSKESIGYPTQKPEKLLERIIRMSSIENELILDPFAGGGTTIITADKLNRKWIGIDQSVQAIKVTEFRLNIFQNKDIYEKGNLFAQPFVVQLYKYDYDTLFNRNAFEFETWIIDQFGGIANTKQKGDLGIDGKTRENVPIQVKQSENIGRNVIDNFNSAIKRFDKALYDNNITENKIAGYIIAFSFGKGAIQEVARLKNDENVIIQLVRVDEIVPISVKPTLTVEIIDKGQNDKHLREIDFVANGETTEGKHIEFYAWDFNYNEKQFCAEILRDTQGKQTKTFKSGEYKIAVKVIDNEGLENTEIIKLKVNGKIEKY